MSKSTILARRIVAVVAIGALVSACQTIAHQTRKELPKDQAARRIVVLPPDVELSILHAGGLEEPNAEWTRAARRHIADDLATRFRAMNVPLVNGGTIAPETSGDGRELQLLKLHEAVGQSILIHQYQGPLQLPTKAATFDWSLGPQTQHLRQKYGADFALFVFVRDSYASAGRVATIVVAALFGVGVQGGIQIGFASLVDLKTGEVVWFNRLARPSGDLRTATAATETVNQLLADFPK